MYQKIIQTAVMYNLTCLPLHEGALHSAPSIYAPYSIFKWYGQSLRWTKQEDIKLHDGKDHMLHVVRKAPCISEALKNFVLLNQLKQPLSRMINSNRPCLLLTHLNDNNDTQVWTKLKNLKNKNFHLFTNWHMDHLVSVIACVEMFFSKNVFLDFYLIAHLKVDVYFYMLIFLSCSCNAQRLSKKTQQKENNQLLDLNLSRLRGKQTDWIVFRGPP